MDYKQKFMDYLDENDITYDDLDDGLVKICFGGDNAKTIEVIASLEEDNPDAELASYSIGNFKNNYEAGIRVCDEMNREYRWVKFYLDSDADVVAKIYVRVDEYNCGEFCAKALVRLVDIIDATYPNFLRALWS